MCGQMADLCGADDDFFRKGREFLTRLYKRAPEGLIYLFTGRCVK